MRKTRMVKGALVALALTMAAGLGAGVAQADDNYPWLPLRKAPREIWVFGRMPLGGPVVLWTLGRKGLGGPQVLWTHGRRTGGPEVLWTYGRRGGIEVLHTFRRR